jgi:NAD/NADP transhydrogenase alpha subunit
VRPTCFSSIIKHAELFTPSKVGTSIFGKKNLIYDVILQIPPCKVLVIGAGVAGLSAIATVSLNHSFHDEPAS